MLKKYFFYPNQEPTHHKEYLVTHTTAQYHITVFNCRKSEANVRLIIRSDIKNLNILPHKDILKVLEIIPVNINPIKKTKKLSKKFVIITNNIS